MTNTDRQTEDRRTDRRWHVY